MATGSGWDSGGAGGRGEWRAGSSLESAPAEGYNVTHTGRGGQFCPHFSLMVGPPAPPASLCCCCVGWGGREKCHCHRSPRQRRQRNPAVQWGQRHIAVELYQGHVRVSYDRAATPAPPSTGSASCCPPAALKRWWWAGAGGRESLLSRGLLGQEQVVMRIPRDLGCPSGSGIQTLASAVPHWVEDLGPELWSQASTPPPHRGSIVGREAD